MSNCILHFAFCFVCGDLGRFVDTGMNYVRCCDYSLLCWVMRAGSPWTSTEIIFRKWAVVADHVMNSGNRNKLYSKTAWTFVIPDGTRPLIWVCRFLWCIYLKWKIPQPFVTKWTQELKKRCEPLISQNLRVVFLALVSIFTVQERSCKLGS